MYGETEEAYSARPLLCIGPFQGLRRYARYTLTCALFLKFAKAIPFNHNQFRLLFPSSRIYPVSHFLLCWRVAEQLRHFCDPNKRKLS